MKLNALGLSTHARTRLLAHSIVQNTCDFCRNVWLEVTIKEKEISFLFLPYSSLSLSLSLSLSISLSHTHTHTHTVDRVVASAVQTNSETVLWMCVVLCTFLTAFFTSLTVATQEECVSRPFLYPWAFSGFLWMYEVASTRNWLFLPKVFRTGSLGI